MSIYINMTAIMKRKNVNLTVVKNKAFEATAIADINHLDLVSALQTTLDFSQLIAIFCNKIRTMIPHTGILYEFELFDLEYKKGIATKNSCSYTLKIDDMHLGKLTLMRHVKFSEREMSVLENLLCSLIYPLRNATLYKQAERMAHTDPLTKTQNRVAFNTSIDREFQLANRKAQHLSMIFIDIDHFKSINDSFGHECGDMALISVAKVIKDSIRSSDMLFRYGGEEFVVLLSATDLTAAEEIAERIRIAVENHTFVYEMQPVPMTISLGVSTLAGNDTPQSFINRTDKALYQAKAANRNNVYALNYDNFIEA